ncbi:uncharacterized protein TRAVEDRAFT_50333 [Trametes versicolor FP-101664 SS1]|uniref:uncharacterized protein n=1 Tax=Trametes versicolor (strain FP-101664) TaxID=717944 RepID=UPI00046232D0|nr:uncharacterized protein TRAVEDRAFT_50333 [Trametes versicolor FP-101664 SS1]EIW55851.1 hypothetical protein TRAVEDRAFT_50333 [Trametes versicolor FP-101664 SS1]
MPTLYYVVKNVFTRRRRTQSQFTSSQFVLSAGAISFEFVEDRPEKVLLVHYTRKNEWLLAKGRKDQGEDLAATAIREVFEETGYRCHIHPVPRLPTRAPPPVDPSAIAFQSDIVRIVEGGTEPFMITIRPTSLSEAKLIFWYIGSVDIAASGQESAPSAPERGTHMALEGFGEAGLYPIEEALQMLTYEGDRDLVRTAVNILT